MSQQYGSVGIVGKTAKVLFRTWDGDLLSQEENLPPRGTRCALAVFPFGVASDGSLGPHGVSLVERVVVLLKEGMQVEEIIFMGGWPFPGCPEKCEAWLGRDYLSSRVEKEGICLPKCIVVETQTLDTWQQGEYLAKWFEKKNPLFAQVVGVAIPQHVRRVALVLREFGFPGYVARSQVIPDNLWRLNNKRVLQSPYTFAAREKVVILLYKLGMAGFLSKHFTKSVLEPPHS